MSAIIGPHRPREAVCEERVSPAARFADVACHLTEYVRFVGRCQSTESPVRVPLLLQVEEALRAPALRLSDVGVQLSCLVERVEGSPLVDGRARLRSEEDAGSPAGVAWSAAKAGAVH